MNEPTTIGREILNARLPERWRGRFGVLDEKGIASLLDEVAHEEPGDYPAVAKAITDVGAETATYYGNEASFSLADFDLPEDVADYRRSVKRSMDDIVRRGGSNDDIVKLLSDTVAGARDRIGAAMKAGKGGLAAQVSSGARGNVGSATQILFGDIMLDDAQGNPVPIPALDGYAEGVSPLAYWASTHGARKGQIDVQDATARAGYLGKQLTNVAHRVVVTEDDCGTSAGIPADPSDPDLEGSLLAIPVGDMEAGTEIGRGTLKGIKDKVYVRSSTTCQAKHGICSKCAGRRESGDFPSIGDPVGIVASRAVSEPVTQSGLCLARGTMVRMADWSVKAIEDIKKGDVVLGADITGKTAPAAVVNTFDNGKRDVHRIQYRRGSTREIIQIECTLDHKILQATFKSSCSGAVYNGIPRILPAGEPGCRVSAVLHNGLKESYGDMSEPFALLIGLLLGDGCYTESVGSVHFSCADDTLIEETKPYMDSLGLRFSQLKYHNGIYYSVSSDSKGGARDIVTGQAYKGGVTNPIKKYLCDNNMWGKYAHEKEMPPGVFGWDMESVAAILAGLFITDGSIYYSQDSLGVNKHKLPYIKIALTTRVLVQQIKDLLEWRFGIHCPNIYTKQSYDYTKKGEPSRPGYFNKARESYNITISQSPMVRRFLTNIKMMGKKGKLVEGVHKDEIKARDLMLCSRKSTEPLGMVDTFDIEVDNEDHLFVLANGMIVSNSTKHSGGISAGVRREIQGFDEMNQYFQVPPDFIGGAPVSTLDGTVSNIAKGAVGGYVVTVDGEDHFVPPGKKLSVSKGDTVERGDALSEGVPSPADIVAMKGIGEGRRYFVDRFIEALNSNKASVNRRNVEAVARGFINRVEVTDPDGVGDALPGDVVPYDDIVRGYEPRDGFVEAKPEQASGMYLEEPVLHYAIGDRITPSVVRNLAMYKVGSVKVHKEPPGFRPVLVGATRILESDPDWMTRLSGERLKGSMLTAARRGATSTPYGTSYIPAVADPSRLRPAGASIKDVFDKFRRVKNAK